MPSALGLDISPSSFKVVQVSKRGKDKNARFFVDKVLYYDIPNGDLDLESERLSKEIENFIKEANFSTSNACLSIPESKVFFTLIETTLDDNKSIESYLELEGGNIFPMPVSDITYSFEVVGTTPTSKKEVAVVASSNVVVNNLYRAATKAGLNVLGIEPESYSLARALSVFQDTSINKAILIVDIGHYETNIVIVDKRVLRFSKTLPIGGINLTKSLVESLGVSYEQADEYKKAYGLDQFAVEGKISTSLQSVVNIIFTEVKRVIGYYSVNHGSFVFGKVLFSGGVSLMPGLLEYAADILGMEVELANPFINLTFPSNFSSDLRENIVMERGPIYSVSVGLALKTLVS